MSWIEEADWTMGDWTMGVNPGTVLRIRRGATYQTKVAAKLRSQRTGRWRDCNIQLPRWKCFRTDWSTGADGYDWLGRERLRESGSVGLLLDLNEGTLTVFKNGRRLGVMKDGLGGEYVWFVTSRSTCTISVSKGRAPN